MNNIIIQTRTHKHDLTRVFCILLRVFLLLPHLSGFMNVYRITNFVYNYYALYFIVHKEKKMELFSRMR